MPAAPLHIVPADGVGDRIRAMLPDAEILEVPDDFSRGPLRGAHLFEFLDTRARFGHTDPSAILKHKRSHLTFCAQLYCSIERPEVILWFLDIPDHQLALNYVLHRLSEIWVPEHLLPAPPVRIVKSTLARRRQGYRGLTAGDLAEMYQLRVPVPREQAVQASHLWSQYAIRNMSRP